MSDNNFEQESSNPFLCDVCGRVIDLSKEEGYQYGGYGYDLLCKECAKEYVDDEGKACDNW